MDTEPSDLSTLKIGALNCLRKKQYKTRWDSFEGSLTKYFLFFRGKSFPHDIKTQSGLTSLYNKRVVSSQAVERPLAASKGGQYGNTAMGAANAVGITTSYSGRPGQATHSGSLVTTSDGSQYLVHKGDGFGKSSDTVVVDAKHMSKNWTPVGSSKDVGGRASVSHYVKAGGQDYHLRGGNCHNATRNMQNLGNQGGNQETCSMQ